MARSLCVCGNIRDSRKPCDKCGQGKQSRDGAVYGSAWDRLSIQKRDHDPLCERCITLERCEPAVHVHHIVPVKIRPDLKLEWSNLMSVCQACHAVLDAECDAKYGNGSAARYGAMA